MIIYGKQVFIYILENHHHLIKNIYLSKQVDKKLFNKIKKLNKKITLVDAKKAQSMARGGNHQGFLVEIDDIYFDNKIDDKNFLVVLDNITDMGNIGAIIRSAYALGADEVVITGIRDLKIANIIRSSAGAALDMKISHYFNILDLVNELKTKKYTLFGADMDGEDVENVVLDNKRALFLGSEGFGLNKKVISRLDKKISIKMNRNFDSLNVSVAAGILIYKMRG